ncbi:MAG: mechanosensitive ion channel family protein [Clostridia bacterium]|nr:mechanosensitive ion channel family protein [Clostridia bacterium]
MEENIQKLLSNNIFQSCLVVLGSILIYEILNNFIFKKAKGKNSRLSNRNKTYVKVFSSFLRYALIIINIFTILQINGINVDSILAGAGIIGIIVGFAVQDALKDIIRGMTILTDRYFQVGDVVQYGEVMGKVISTGLNTTKIEDLKTFNIVSVANRNIEQIQVVSDSVDIMVPFSYELPLSKAEMVVTEIIEQIRLLPDVKKCEYKGVSNLKESNIECMINIRVEPTMRRPITRQVHGIILRTLERNNIEIPYNQLDIHQK